MTLQSYASNLYAPQQFVDVSFVFIVIDADGAIVAAQSSPELTVTAGGSGDYAVTFPPGVTGVVVGATLVATASDGVFVEVTAFDPSAGTATLELSDEADLGGDEQIHAVIALFNQ